MAFINIIQDTAIELGIPKPNAAFSSGDLNIQKLITAAQQVGAELVEMKPWPQLRTLSSISLADGVETYALAADFGRQVDETQWESDQKWPAFGPLTSQEWAWLKYGTVAVGPTRRYSVFGFPLEFKVQPTPTAGDVGTVIYYTYISNAFCQSSTGTLQSQWTLDTDVGRLPERLFKLGIRARYLRLNGYPYADAELEYRNNIDTLFGQAIGGRTLDVGGMSGWDTPLVSGWNVGDSNYGG